MVMFHISDDGNPRVCNAQEGNCPLGGGRAEHFTTAENARTYYEESQGSSFQKPKKPTHESRIASLPEINGISYSPEPFNAKDVNDDGFAFSSADVLRMKRNGEVSRIANIAVYDDGMVLIWDRGDADAADFKARRKFADEIRKNFAVSAISSPIYRGL